ncbi:MAG: metallophosphoesterase [Candidatus Eisenbacteria sp.]|nr:metallophosphoesterase [Candidatus Eisenbacteria bacterium]
MHILLVADIHGNFSILNQLAHQVRADVIILAGDLQMQSHNEMDRISDRELWLRITHSPQQQLAADLDRHDRATLVSVVQEHRLLGQWDDVLDGSLELEVPVYAVWGNHEDAQFVAMADAGKLEIPNLTFLTGREDFILDGWLRVSGIGGNLLVPAFLGTSLVTRDGRITATLEIYATIQDRWRQLNHGSELRVFVQHVSPHKDRACANPLLHIRPDLIISGHMGPPFPQQFSLYGPYRPADIGPLHAWPARRLQAIIKEMTLTEPLMAMLDQAEQFLKDEGPDAFVARYLRGEHPLKEHVGPYFKLQNPDPKRRCVVALSRARADLERRSYWDLVGDERQLSLLRSRAFLLDPPEPFAASDDLTRRSGRGDNLLKKISSINLPDAGDGYVLLKSNRKEHRLEIESYGGIRI